MKKIITLVIVFLLLLTGSGAFAESNKDVQTLSDVVNQNEQEIIEGFNKLGINKETQENLLKKLKNGEALDSMKEENLNIALDLGGESNNYNSLSNISGNQSKIITFPDGSKAEIGIELIEFIPDKDEGIDLFAKHKSLSPGTYKIKTYWSSVIANTEFYSDVVIVKGKNNDSIKKVYDGSYVIIGGTLKSQKVTRHRATESSKNYAHASYKVEYELMFDLAAGSQTITLLVGNDGYQTKLGSKSSLK